jgi:1-acyl-sn-glycerol-3-phosphate acyltransferase
VVIVTEQRWHYETAADIDQSMSQRLRSFPRQPDILVYLLRWLASIVLRGWLRLYHRLRIAGRANLPATGSFILVANHSSHLDALCLLAALPLRKVHRAFPAAAQDYFFVSLPRIAVAAIFVNAMPFARQLHIRQSLELCRQLLANPGNILILFPEGGRSVSGEMGEFRPGIGMLLAGSDVPVVPCALQGAHAAWPKGAVIPRPRTVRLIIGRPRSYPQVERTGESAHQIARELQEAVKELLCQ